MHFPELSLFAGGEKGLCGPEGVVPVLVGVIYQGETDLAGEFIEQSLDGRTGRLAVRSLKVEKLDDGYGSIFWSLVGPIGNIDADPLFRSHGRQCHQHRPWPAQSQ